MLFSPVFAKLQSRSSILTLSGSAKPQHRPNPPVAPRASTPTTGQTVCKLVNLRTPTDSCIPFLFNHPSSLRLRRRPTERYVSHLFSSLCGRFPSRRGVYPIPLVLSTVPRFDLLYLPSSIPFLFNRLQYAPPATPLL